MKNRGFSRFEVIAIILLILIVGAYLAWNFLSGADVQKYNTMKNNAVNLSKVTAINISAFHNKKIVYLDELIDEGFIGTVKSPFSKNDCSKTESKVEINDDTYKVTLKCDDYLIDGEENFDELKNIPIYKVTEWSLIKPEGEYEEKVLYNCLDNGKEKYSEYLEELYLISHINSDYDKEYNSIDDVGDMCKIINKTFYRTREIIK